MSKYKVFMPSGTVQTIIADSWSVDWSTGRLRFATPEDITVAVFASGGWHGVQNMEVYKKIEA